MFLLIACCNSNTSKNDTDLKTNKSSNKSINEEQTPKGNIDYDQLRKKTNVTEAASAVGYDGKAIKKELNKVIDQQEKMSKEFKDLDL